MQRMPNEHERAKWTSDDSDASGFPEFEIGSDVNPDASRGQIVLACNCADHLAARTGVCLVIMVYHAATRVGMLIHIGRDEEISDEEMEFIRKPFDAYPQIDQEPEIAFVSSKALRAEFSRQLEELEKEFDTITDNARVRHIMVAEVPEGEDECSPICCEVRLDTVNGVVYVRDDYGDDQEVTLGSDRK